VTIIDAAVFGQSDDSRREAARQAKGSRPPIGARPICSPGRSEGKHLMCFLSFKREETKMVGIGLALFLLIVVTIIGICLNWNELP